MPLQVLLLLILLGSGSSLQLWEIWEDGTKKAPDPLLVRGRRQVEEDLEQDVYDYVGTDPPEMLVTNSTGPVPLTSKLLAEMATLGQKDSGTPEPATLEAARGDSVGLDSRGMALGNLSTEVATQGVPDTLGPLSKEQVTTLPPIIEALSTELATIEALSTEPAATEALTTQPAATEAPSTEPAAPEALTTQPAATEAPSTEPAAPEALTTQLAATEAPSTEPAAPEVLTTQPAATEAPSTEPAATEALTTQPMVPEALSTSTEPPATEALSTDPATMKVPSTGPATTRRLTTAQFVPSDPHDSTTTAGGNSSDGFVKQWKNNQNLSPQSSVAAPSPTEAPDRIPVKQCLLAILILALVATIFLVCTVVLAVRLSRKNHMYPVRNYSPTEMVCISSLLPEGGEAPAATANGDLPSAKSQGLKAGPGEGRDGDDLTLQSFLP